MFRFYAAAIVIGALVYAGLVSVFGLRHHILFCFFISSLVGMGAAWPIYARLKLGRNLACAYALPKDYSFRLLWDAILLLRPVAAIWVMIVYGLTLGICALVGLYILSVVNRYRFVDGDPMPADEVDFRGQLGRSNITGFHE